MEKINVAELLKDCIGMELDCAIFNDARLERIDPDEVDEYPIQIDTSGGHRISLTKYGTYIDAPEAKCVIFPKGKTTWEGFQRPFKDGDIVASNCGSQVFIFKEYVREENNYAYCYVFLNDDDGTVDFECDSYFVSRLATEEEKQRLFDAIKANGYRWNAEINTLEKLPMFKVGDKIRLKENHNYIYTITGIREKENKYECGVTFVLRFSEQGNWELVRDKFDISTLKPFDKVLVRNTNNGRWCGQFYMSYDENEDYPFECTYNCWMQCIPYKGNEYLLDKTDDCDEYFKTWEKTGD